MKLMKNNNNNYQYGKVYMITNENTKKIYVGSTIHSLEKRFYKHQHNFKSGEYVASADLFMLGGETMIVLLEDYPCNNKQELLCREQYWMDKLSKDNIELVNKCRAFNDPNDAEKIYHEWYVKNKDRVLNRQLIYDSKPENKEKKHEYQRLNREKIIKQKRERREWYRSMSDNAWNESLLSIKRDIFS